MANLIIPIAGAAIGGFIGGPTGAQLGWAAGSAYNQSQQEILQDKLGDLRMQTSAYGIAIPYAIGQQRMSGNIIWAQEKKEYQRKHKPGKGGPKQIFTGYTVSFAVAICKGPILGVSRIWFDGKLVIDGSDGSAKAMPGELYLGDNSQTPDPTIEGIEGAGNVPAYRGMCYMVMTDLDLGVQGRVPNMSFEVIREGGF